jgi:PKD repeat protein
LKTALSIAILLLSIIASPLAVSAQITYPSPGWDYEPLTPRVGDAVTFDASLFMDHWTESKIVSLVWDFGDGTTDTGTDVIHVFISPGDYLVGLTATDDRGLGGTSQKLVTVTEQTPVTISLFLSSETIYIGQAVTLSGDLIYQGAGMPDAEINFSTKTYADNAQWISIGSTKTSGDGSYSFVWASAVSTGYQVRAAWAGNATYPQTSLSRILYVQSFGDLIAGVSSNSTVRGMNYNMTTRLLSFTAEGPSGSSGYVNVTLEKDPLFDPDSMVVLLDGQPISYTAESTDQTWTVHFTYSHSVHSVLVDFTGKSAYQTQNADAVSPDKSEPSSFIPMVIVGALGLIAVSIGVVVLTYKKRQSQHRTQWFDKIEGCLAEVT